MHVFKGLFSLSFDDASKMEFELRVVKGVDVLFSKTRSTSKLLDAVTDIYAGSNESR